MKILVVDDESNKLKAIMRVVKEIDGIELDSVDITLQLNEAKEKLLNHRYDLMILDLNMPEVLGSDPDKEAGINFIEEVIYVESYKKPRDKFGFFIKNVTVKSINSFQSFKFL